MRRKLIAFGLLILGICVGFILFAKPSHAPTKHANTPCQALAIKNLKAHDKVHQSFTVETVVTNSGSCHWTVFEGQAGSVEVKDTDGQTVARSALKTQQDWTTTDNVTYTATLKIADTAPSGNLLLLIHEESPSGKEGQTISLPLSY